MCIQTTATTTTTTIMMKMITTTTTTTSTKQGRKGDASELVMSGISGTTHFKLHLFLDYVLRLYGGITNRLVSLGELNLNLYLNLYPLPPEISFSFIPNERHHHSISIFGLIDFESFTF